MKEKNCFNSVAFLGEPSPERFEAVIQSISEGVFTVDREWHITCFNRTAEEITGIPSSEALGSPAMKFLDQTSLADALERMGGNPGAGSKKMMKKTDLVRGIQQAESTIECYGTERVDYCNEHECLWRNDCLSLNGNNKVGIT